MVQPLFFNHGIGTTMFVKSTIASLLIVMTAGVAAQETAPSFGENRPSANLAGFVQEPQGSGDDYGIMLLPLDWDEETGAAEDNFPKYNGKEEAPEAEKAPAESAEERPEPVEPEEKPAEKPSQPETEPEVQPTAPSIRQPDVEAFRTRAGLRAAVLSESFDTIRAMELHAVKGDELWAEASAVNAHFGAYETDRNGLAVGMQKNAETYTIGIAFRAVDGEMNAYDWNALSASVYGAFATGRVRHVLTANFARHDLDGTSYRLDSVFGSYKAETPVFVHQNGAVTAYAGVRGVFMRDEANDNSGVYQLPFGVRAAAGTEIENARVTVAAFAEGACTGGDRALKLGSVETAAFASVRSVAAGVEARFETETFSLTASYQYAAGSDDQREQRGMVKAGLRF